MFQQQWGFSGASVTGTTAAVADINIQSVWGDYTGLGVRIGLIDNFFDIDHPELQGRFDLTTSRDLADAPGSVNIRPDDIYSNHGTMVASVLGANGTDGTGMTGTAFGATLVGYVLRFGGTAQARTTLVSHLTHQLSDNIDVVNNSWSFSTAFADDFGTSLWSDLAAAINAHASQGRDGLGTVMVVGAGNDRQFDAARWWLDGDNTNHHNTTNTRSMITVAATDESGAVAEFSTPGASVFVAAPGEMILTANIDNQDGNAANDFIFARGTSFATPVVSGVIALMLEANAALGYRDVQDILALSARRVDPVGSNWSENGAGYWNGGGFFVNSDVGFGLIDAHAAVRIAESWNQQQTRANEASLSGSVGLTAPMVLTEGAATSAVVQLSAADAFKTQWIELSIDIAHQNIGDLTVVLVSPSGMRSVLIDHPANGTSGRDNLTFTLSSNQFWGENPAGAWTIEITDGGSASTGALRSAELRVFGTESANDTYVFTDDFALLGREAVVLTDATGSDTLNLAALSTAVTIDLAPGHSQSIAGYSVLIDSTTWIERVVTGDGDDQVRGNDIANDIRAGRGDDTIYMTAGTDSIAGGQGADTLVIDGEKAGYALRLASSGIYEFCVLPAAGSSEAPVVQHLTGIETLQFADGAMSIADFLAESTTRFPAIDDTTGGSGGTGGNGDGTGTGDEGDQTNPPPGGTTTNIVIEDSMADEPLLLTTAANGSADLPDTASFEALSHSVRVRLADPSAVSGISAGANAGYIVVQNLIGSIHADRLTGNDSDNVLNGGNGADTLVGGDGNDHFIVDAANDSAVEGASGGHDEVTASCSYQLPDWIEDLVLTGAARIATGNGENNRIIGNDGNNVLDGRAGDDTLAGGQGNDRYTVDSIGDLITEAAANGVDTVYSSVSYSLQNNIEELTLTGDDATDATGNALNNKLIGNGGDNALDGGVGADWMSGGAGDDTYFMDNLSDRAVEAVDSGIDMVVASVSARLAVNIEALTLTGHLNLRGTGNDLANTLTGNDGNNLLNGLAGADTMAGGRGNDRYEIDSIGDRIIEQAGQGTDYVYSAVSYTLQDNIEQLVLTGSDDNTATGNGLDNLLKGNAGNNVIDGGAGADWMAGGAGNDIYYADTVRDRVVEAQGGGFDTIYSSVSMRLAGYVEALTLVGSQNLVGTGNTLANTITGNAGNNRLFGGLGNDTLTGGAGADVFVFDTRLDKTANVDVITDFDTNADYFVLEDAVFSRISKRGWLSESMFHIGSEATEQSQRIIYDADAGDIYYDRDGSGLAAKVLFAHIAPQSELSRLDFLVV